MIKSDFENYVPYLGRGNYLARELLALVNHAELYPSTAAQLLTLFDLDVAKVRAKLQAAAAVPVTGVTLTPETVSVAVGATSQLTAVVAPADATNKTVTYASGTPGVATVSASGLVTGVSAGSATVTATASGKTDTTAVTVTAP